MSTRKAVLPLFLALVGPALYGDQITLKNGDRVTGQIVKKDGSTLTIKSAFMGTVTVPWDQISDVKADSPITVVLPSGTVQGTVTTSGSRIQISGRPESVPLAEVVAIRDAAEQEAFDRLQRPRLSELWAGTAALGFAGTAGNARTLTFTTGVNAARVTKTDKTSLYFSAIKASALVNGKSSETAQAVRGGIGYDHNVSKRLFVNIFNDYEYDRFQNLDLRFVLGGGFGFHAVKTDRSELNLLGGLDYNHSKFSTPLTRNSAEFFWGDEYSYKLSGASSLVQSFRMFNNLSDTGTYRMNFDIGASTKIAKWLSWNVALSDRYLNHPAPGRKTNDFLYTTGVGVTFAR